MTFQKITPAFIQALETALGTEAVFLDSAIREAHAEDTSFKLHHAPEVVVKPSDTEGVSKLLRLCHEARIPVTVQGARSGIVGGAVPICGGVALSMERFDKILHIDKANYQVTVEPGVITEHLQNQLQADGLFYPPDPSGRGWSFIGGNIATNAGGPRCVKYGVTRDYVLNLEIVLATGEVMWTGVSALKNSTGYNLTHLITGSEGTLAVVTKIVLKLLPYPAYNLLMLAPFERAEDACTAVARIFQAGVIPSALEFMDSTALHYAARYIGGAPFPILPEHEAQLIIEVDGQEMDTLYRDCEKIAEAIADLNVGEILFADSEAQKNDLWKLRRNVAHALIQLCYGKLTDDAVVPRTVLPDLLRGVKTLETELNFKTANVGHVGDGNMHVILINENPNESEVDWYARMQPVKRAIFELIKSLGGMLSAEHGVGYVQKPFMPIFFNEAHLNILRGIKKTFDPHGILNPQKIFDER
jgi:glycolate oxidase